MALTVPNTDANAGKAASNASKIMIAIDRFDILIPRGTSSQVPFLVFNWSDNRLAAAESLPGHEKEAGK
jgi:hypothetical protein